MDRKDARRDERMEAPPEVPLPLPAVRSGRGAYVPWVVLVIVVVFFALLFGTE
jgi:hypothetical protein